MLRKIEELNHSNVGCTCARWEKNIWVWAEKFNMVEGPGKHVVFQKKWFCCLCGMEKVLFETQ